MRNYSQLTRGLSGLVVSLSIVGCTCELPSPNVGARVVITTITAPPGGPGRRFLEVQASGFHPNAAAKVSIFNYPTFSGSVDIEEAVTLDSTGALHWTKEPITLLTTGADPNTDITIKVSESNSDCVSVTLIKQREFMRVVKIQQEQPHRNRDEWAANPGAAPGGWRRR
jgi:hypothetical protein